jgi:hypothetical protein
MRIRDERQVAVPCCRVYNLSARARYSRGGSLDIYELAQPQIIFNPIFPLYNWNYVLFKFVIF